MAPGPNAATRRAYPSPARPRRGGGKLRRRQAGRGEEVEESPSAPESSFAFYLEDASLVTLGIAYEQKPKFGGGAYHPVLRRVETFSDEPIRTAMKAHERRAALLLELEEKVAEAVTKLKERGLQSPYLRSFVVARVNPLR